MVIWGDGGYCMRLLRSNHKKNRRNLLKMQGKDNYKVKKNKACTREEFMDNVIRKLNISEDVLTGAEVMTLVGKRSLVIENYLKVLEYEPDEIKIKTKRNNVCICGENLRIEYLYDVELRVTGKIHSVSFELKNHNNPKI